VTFQRSRTKSAQAKTSKLAGKTSAGKKSATTVDANKEPQKVYALEKMPCIWGGINGACLLRDWCYRIYPRPGIHIITKRRGFEYAPVLRNNHRAVVA
jgi:hypothetical protein